MDMDNLFDSQDFYAGQGSGQGSGLPFCHGNQDYYTSQDYFIGHGSGHGSAHDSTFVKDDSPVEDVAPVKVKKDHAAWKEVEIPSFYMKKGYKKSKTSKTTSGLVQGGFNLNDEASGPEEEIREERSIGRDRVKKKASSSSSRSATSSIIGGGLVELVADKWKSIKLASWGKKKEQQDSYIELKNRELVL
nr:hypothetical protein [Tanacetum cinerariifolium]